MLRQRLSYGVPLAAIFAVSMAFLPGPILFLILVAFAAACQWEFYALAARGGYRVYNRMGLTLGVLWKVAVYILETPPGVPTSVVPGWETAMLIVICFAVLLRTMGDAQSKRAFETTAITFLGIFYGPVMLSYFLRLAQWDAGAPLATTRAGVFLCFYLALVIKLSDTGAYAFGSLLGRHKLCPRISPAKTWEGLVGGLATGVGIGLLLAAIARPCEWGPAGIFWAAEGQPPLMTPWRTAAVSLVLCLAGVFGDLIESMFKRSVQAKDSSGLFPGIGGLLDVVDSLIFAPPCLYCFLLWSST